MEQFTIAAGTRPGAVEIYFDGKPTEEIRTALKSLQMRWNNAKKCWYSFTTADEIISTLKAEPKEKSILAGLNLKKIEGCYTIDTTDTEGYMGATATRGSNCNTREYDLTKALREKLKECGFKNVYVRRHSYSMGQTFYITVKVPVWAMLTKEAYTKIRTAEFCPQYNFYIEDNGSKKRITLADYYNASGEEQKKLAGLAAENEYSIFLKHCQGECGADINKYYIEKDDRLSEDLKKYISYINQIVLSFNRDSSNSMVDYFDTNFYYNISLKVMEDK